MFNTSHSRFCPTGVLSPKEGLLPKHLPADDVVEVYDVHLGAAFLWKGMRGVLFCDIDGTVADLTHRRVHVENKPKNWPAFEKGIPHDTPIQTIIDVVRTLHDSGWTIVMCTGRGAQHKDITVAWLEQHGVPFHAIYTRAFKDYRADNIVKAELLEQARGEGYDPDVVFDDRDQVVRMWRDAGVPCVQVAEGDF